MPQGHFGLFPLRLESNSHDGLKTSGGFRHPGIFHLARALNAKKPSIVRPGSSFVLDRMIEEAVHHGVQDCAVRAEGKLLSRNLIAVLSPKSSASCGVEAAPCIPGRR